MKDKLRLFLLHLGAYIYSNRESKILFYHDIYDDTSFTDMSTPLELFKKHIKTIRENSFLIVSEITEKENQVKLQFDDGFCGIYDCIEYLVEENIPVEIFIITSFIGKRNYLNRKQIIKLLKTNLVKISSHTHSHKELDKLSYEQLDTELSVSKQLLENLTEKPVSSICYPIGKFSNQVIRSCNNMQYTFQYSSIPGSYFDNPFSNVYRRNLVQFASPKEIFLVLKGANFIFNKLYLKKHLSK